MSTFSALIFSGLAFGLSSGITPGPLMMVLIAQTIRFGAREGGKIACAPLITDLPIILLSVIVFARLTRLDTVLGIITLCGGLFLIYLGWESISFKGVEYVDTVVAPRSIRKGVLANFFNPSPYLFWFTIGAPLLVESGNLQVSSAAGFLVTFYGTMVGSKLLIAILVGRSRQFLKSRYYVYSLRILGVVLWIFAIIFLKNSLKYFGLA